MIIAFLKRLVIKILLLNPFFSLWLKRIYQDMFWIFQENDQASYWKLHIVSLSWNELFKVVIVKNFELNFCKCSVVVITTAQLHSTKPELRFCKGSNLACGMSKICNGGDLWQWSRLEIRQNVFRRSTILQKQFIITIIINAKQP